ncbi:MAG: restriction endonuclease [Thermoguttaceae bacterium]
MEPKNLPFGSEFTPAKIDLVRLLELAKANANGVNALELALRMEYFDSYKTDEGNRETLAMNCRLSMTSYGLVNAEGTLTEIGQQLLSLKKDRTRLYAAFARHILLNLHGLAVLQVVQDMQAHRQKISLVSLRQWLAEQGIIFARGGKNASTMRLWLQAAGILQTGSWRINEDRLEETLGASSAAVDQLATLSPQQKAFLRTLANIGTQGPYSSNEIESLATTLYGARFNEKGVPRQVLYPLEKAGYITLTRHGAEGSHGAKPFQVGLTEKMQADLIGPLLDAIDNQVAAELRPLLRKTLPEILEEVKSEDRYKKGLALEALAFHLMRLVDLQYAATRLRGTSTGGAEVDLVFEGARLLFSRWQIQCKNTGSVSLDDVAKEVGLTFQLKSNVVMVVSTGKISDDARHYAQVVMQSSNINVVLLDTEDLRRIAEVPPIIGAILNREARRAMQLKKLDLE